MHLVAIRRELAAKEPDLCVAVCDAFEEAKRLAFEAMEGYSSLAVSLPWAPANLAEARTVMGEDFWPYGIERNRPAIEAVTRYSAAQGLASRIVRIEELFAAPTLEWSPDE
jgi:4,5-dihydroxyphthalate decarboxylase